MSNIAPIDALDDDGCRKRFEMNIIESFNGTRAFLQHAAADGNILNVNADLAMSPTIPGLRVMRPNY
jgi:hypothetical protein